MRTLLCPTPETTRAAGRSLGARLQPGMVILLHGDLGAGKTTFAQGLAEGYGIGDRVTSPSFALINEYRTGDRHMVHFDPYRLEYAAAMHDIGWLDYVGGDALMVIEWPERLGDSVPIPYLRVRITASDDGTRSLELTSDPPDFVRTYEEAWP